MSIKFQAELDSERFDKGLAMAKKKVSQATASMVTGIRRVAQVGISLSQVFGTMLDQSLMLGIEAGLLGIELIVAYTVALTTMAPLSALWSLGFKGAMKVAAIASMIVTIGQMQRGRTALARTTMGSVSAFRLLAF